MSRRRISQAEARAAIARVAELEADEDRRRRAWASDWPYGVNIGTITWDEAALVCEAAMTARRLGHAVVAVPDSTRKRIDLFALPLSAAGRGAR